MKVLLASTGCDMSSGAAKCLVELAQGLEKRGVDVLVAVPCHGNMETHLREKRIKYVYIHEYHAWYTSEKHIGNHFYLKRVLNIIPIIKAIYLINKEKVDVIHENALTAYTLARAGEICKKPVVWHIREFMEEDLNIWFFDKKYSARILNKCSVFLAISKAIKDKWDKLIDKPVSLVYDGVPVNDYYIERQKPSVEKFSTVNKVRLLIYGRIVPNKGQLFFFEGIERLVKNGYKNIEAIWAGQIEDSDYYDRIYQFQEHNDIGEYCHYRGEVKDIKGLLAETDIVCVCSQSEGFGRVTVESQMAGCIVLGANTGATPEIIHDGINGYLYENNSLEDFSDKLCYIVDNLDSAKEVAMVGQEEAVAKYSVDTNVENVISVYKRLLDGRKENGE